MENLIRRRAMPSVYVNDNVFTTPLHRNHAENGRNHASLGTVSGQMTSPATEGAQSKGRVTFNIGGTIFQTTEKVFMDISEKYFTAKDTDFLSQNYDEEKDEFFFDRDPEVFRSVLNYWRTGHLHIPTTMCGPQIIDEMEFWGLSPVDIEPCCFNTYNSWIKSMYALQKLEKDRQLSYLKPSHIRPKTNESIYKRASLAIWYLLTDPSYSKCAKVYAYLSLFFVSLTIFSFCASTYKGFQVTERIYINKTSTNGVLPDMTNYNTRIHNQTSGVIPQITTTPTATAPNANNDDKIAYINTNGKHYVCHMSPSPADVKSKKADYIEKTDVHPALYYIDLVCLALFTLEYLIRLICAPRRIKFIISFTAVIDLLAIMPDYIEFIVYSLYPENSENSVVKFMPFLRLMRVFRIFRLAQRVPGLWIMIYTLRASFKELSLMLMFLLVGTLFFSAVIYFVDDQTIFESIPHSFWWAIVTMTTVGYGDLTPTTAWGQMVGSVTAVCGVLLVGFTIPALVNNFITYCQFVEFAMRNEEAMEEDVRRVSRRAATNKEKAQAKKKVRRNRNNNKEVSTSSMTPDSPTNDISCPLTADVIVNNS